MRLKVFAAAFLTVVFSLAATPWDSANAATCSGYTYTFANGTTADAGQVNSNFNTIMGCANTLLAPLNAPVFSGQSSFSTTFANTSSSDTVAVLNVSAQLSPPSSSASDFRALNMSLGYETAASFTNTGADAPAAAWFENRILDSGTIAELDGAQFWGLWAGSDASSLGTVSDIEAAKFTPVESFSNSLTSTITKAVGIHVANASKNTFNLAGQAGILIDAISSGTNNTALLMGQSSIPIGNFAIYDASANASYFNGNVGIGTVTPAQKLEVNGEVKIDTFGSATSTQVCQLSGVLSNCSSSIRYKEDVRDAPFGLKDVMQMRPVTFKWKGRDERDFGLIAEEVAKIDPQFATYKDGKIEGVKYAQLVAVLVNAVKELKHSNDRQSARITQLQQQVASLQQRQNSRSAMSDRHVETLATRAQ